MSRSLHAACLSCLVLAGCAGTGPGRTLASFLEKRGLPREAPVVLVDIDDTVYDRGAERPMPGAADALRRLATDHLIVYLTARPTYAKMPGVTQNRSDSLEFLEINGFPGGPLFTSSLWNWLVRGEGGGKRASFLQLREFGVDRIALAVGDRPHDLEEYLLNGHVPVDRTVIILMDDPDRPDPDRGGLPPDVLARSIRGRGPAWPRILAAYREGELDGGPSWVIAEEARLESPAHRELTAAEGNR